MRIGIIGAGAIGSVVGGMLTKAGHDVTLIDQWPQHVETMRKNGLRLSGTCGDHIIPVKALHIYEAQAITEPFDAVFISVKSYDTEWATHLGIQYLKKPNGVVVDFQNGINDERVAAIAGRDRTLGSVITIGAGMYEPGHAMRPRVVDMPEGVHGIRRAGKAARGDDRPVRRGDQASPSLVGTGQREGRDIGGAQDREELLYRRAGGEQRVAGRDRHSQRVGPGGGSDPLPLDSAAPRALDQSVDDSGDREPAQDDQEPGPARAGCRVEGPGGDRPERLALGGGSRPAVKGIQ